MQSSFVPLIQQNSNIDMIIIKGTCQILFIKNPDGQGVGTKLYIENVGVKI